MTAKGAERETAKDGAIRHDILRPLTATEVEELLALYRHKCGVRNFHFLLLANQCKWNRKLLDIEGNGNLESSQANPSRWVPFRKAFYTHRECDFRQYGTYLSLHVDIKQSVSFHSWQPGCTELFECLSETKLIDWSSGPLLTNVELEFCEQVKQIAASKGVSVQKARRCCGLILPHSQALHLNIPTLPAGYRFGPLRPEHARSIHALWPNNKEGSLQYVQGLIEINKSLGIFRGSGEELVAWVFQNDFGGLGILQVLPEERRKGFGSTLALKLSREIAHSEQTELSVWIIAENTTSMTLFNKIGYQDFVVNEWIQLNPTHYDRAA